MEIFTRLFYLSFVTIIWVVTLRMSRSRISVRDFLSYGMRRIIAECLSSYLSITIVSTHQTQAQITSNQKQFELRFPAGSGG